MPALSVIPTMTDEPVTCRRCGHVFQSFMSRRINNDVALVDRDGDVVFDLVKTCHYCKEVFHWHSNTKQMQEASANYHDLFELLQTLHAPTVRNDGREKAP